MNSTPICLYGMSSSFGYPQSSEPILAPSYELSPCLIKMIQDKPFLGEGNKNSYSHLWDFEETCAYLHIVGMPNKTISWKLFLFSLTGIAKHWYNQNIGSKEIGKCYTLNSVYISFLSLK
jgi:hypothetical protein